MPFYLEQYCDGQESQQYRYVVSKVVSGFSHPQFKPGVVVTYWNGIPIDRAVELNAERNAGSNPDARHARGLEAMTIRPMSMSLPPDEEWVIIGYKSADQNLEIKLPWQVFAPDLQNGVAIALGSGREARRLGLDYLTETIRRTKVALFAPRVLEKTQNLRASRRSARTPDTTGDGAVTNTMPGIVNCRAVTTPSGTFGYLRIYSFAPEDNTGDTFVNEFTRIVISMLGQLPQNGLIIDVRANGGGFITAGERLLQLLTPRRIEPERFDFIDIPVTMQLATLYADLAPWADSIARSVETGATYSQGFPLTSDQEANDIGQQYQGPVVLITDALIYSTTDIFSAGFQDHGIGPILGTAGNTGAGGANVWGYTDLEHAMPEVFKPLPKGTFMRVAARRCTRVGNMVGTPVEDLGVKPDAIHRITFDDLFKDNVDLIAKAASLLKDAKVRALDGTPDVTGSKRTLTLTTRNVTRVDVYLNRRPGLSVDVHDGTTRMELPPLPTILTSVYLEGYDGDSLVVSRRIAVG